jgi:predicted Zn-ribbon and HTH transcriptional regulator
VSREYYLTEHTISDSIALVPKVKKTVWLWQCSRCGYEWLPRDAEIEPKRCPGKNCKSPYWNKERQDTKRSLKAKA